MVLRVPGIRELLAAVKIKIKMKRKMIAVDNIDLEYYQIISKYKLDQ